jgi:hypothetical protein
MKHLTSKQNSFLTLFLSIFIVLTQFKNSANAQISGKVYIDFDLNGILSLSGTEPGMPGVKVLLFLTESNTPFITQTDSAGNYAFSAEQVPAGTKARVEFSGWPNSFEPTVSGVNNYTETQFAQAPTDYINLGIVSEQEFCLMGAGLKIATACYTMGDPLKGGDSGEDVALVLLEPSRNDSITKENIKKEELAKAKAIGATWFSAYHSSANILFLGAITRRHVGLGPLGTGGLYSINLTTKEVSNFLDLKTIGINTGPDPHIDPVTKLNVLPAQKTGRSSDSLAFHAAGKTGLGGAQLSAFKDTLFIINLYDRKLYSIKIANPLVAPENQAEANTVSYPIPHPNCSNGEFVPWAVKHYRGKVYVGVVCTAETSQKKEDLKAAVYELNPTNAVFTNIFEFGLNFLRGPIDNTEGCDTIKSWLPWTKVFPKQCNRPNGSFDPFRAFAVYPQPILSDIEFDEDGSLFLGFMDRTGLQTAQNQPGIAKDDTLNYYGFMSGDLLRAQRNFDGTFSLENNALSGNLTGCGAGTQSGPGGGEFFCDDYWLNEQGGIGHAEISNGSQFKIPGTPNLISTAMDPINGEYLAAGLVIFDTKTGKRKNSFTVYSNRGGTVGKSGGLGDLASICQPFPLSIGNLVWYDKDKDGIPDPEEAFFDDVIVTLHDLQKNGVEIARDTTCNGGQYFFDLNNVEEGLQKNQNYEVRIDLNQVVTQPFPNSFIRNSRRSIPGPQTVKLVEQFCLNPVKATGYSPASLSNLYPKYNFDSSQIILNVNTSYYGRINYKYDIGLVDVASEVDTVDIELKTRVIGDCLYSQGDTAVIQVIIQNSITLASTMADSIYVADTLSANFTLLSAISSAGFYNDSTHLWGPLSLISGQSDTLTLTVKINQNNSFPGGLIYNEAEVVKMIGNDIDSRPNNHVKTEDDYAITSLSLPIVICPDKKESVRISAPLGYASYQWLKDGIRIEGATGSSVEVNAKGSYTVETADGQCPTGQCCPIVIEEQCICPTYCIPVVITRIKK